MDTPTRTMIGVFTAVLLITVVIVGVRASILANSGSGGTTNQAITSESDTYVTSCSITGVGGFEFRVTSDSTGASVSGETIKAIDRLGLCGENQVFYIDNFSESQGGDGWLVPDFPSQATPAGQLSFTISYQGETYNFTTYVPPVGTNCVTFHLPSGNVTSTTAMNGSGSYCS